MTDDMMNLRALVEKSPDADLLREMIGFAAHRLMELEVEGLTGAAYGEKSQERQVQRNGYRDRTWETRAGTIELRIPKLRKGSYFPGFLEPRRMAEKALTAFVAGGVCTGLSTRSVDEVVASHGDKRHSRETANWKSVVSANFEMKIEFMRARPLVVIESRLPSSPMPKFIPFYPISKRAT